MSGTLSTLRKPHAVYRAYDDLGRLLYIGCSTDPDRRIKQHRSDRRGGWGAWYVRHTVEWYPDYVQGREAEQLAILAERPIWNICSHPSFPSKSGCRGPRPEWDIVWCGPDQPPWERDAGGEVWF